MLQNDNAIKCSSCGESFLVDDSSECDTCNKVFCPECAETDIEMQIMGSNEWRFICNNCSEDKYDGGI